MADDTEKRVMISPDEFKLLREFRAHKRENMVIIRSHIDPQTPYVQITLDEPTTEVEVTMDVDQKEKAQVMQFLAALIALDDGVKIEDVTVEYAKRTLQESRKRARESGADPIVGPGTPAP